MNNLDKNKKKEFPFFKENKKLIYFDSALTSLKPKLVIDEITNFYTKLNYSNFRSVNVLSEKINIKFEEAIEKIANFLNVQKEELIFTAGATDGLNDLARVLIKRLKRNDEIILGDFEHASNFLPWIEYGKEKKIKFKYYKINEKFEIDVSDLEKKINEKTKIISIAHVFNTLGTTNNIKEIRKAINKKNKDCILVVDGAQAVGHIETNLKTLDPDCYLFSGHKMFASNGVGICYIKNNLLNKIEPFKYGGGNNIDFQKDKIIYKNVPKNFYSGTLNYPGIFSLSKAIDFIEKIGIKNIENYCNELKNYAEEKLKNFEEIKIINKNVKSSILFLEMKNIPAEDISYLLGRKNILFRSGTNCVKIKNEYFNQNKTIRLSFHIYNEKKEIDKFVNELENALKTFRKLINK
ncbi:MAG: cysteine desulfurase [Candidatus Hepatoplasma vulgare]|nr:MAG: cysteine desulfurase [Candidatus Hepatoplasma sp.]